MVTVAQSLVKCANCNHQQPDRGKRSTCPHCGCSPVPSYSYPPDSGFYPLEEGESQAKRIGRLVALRRAAGTRGR
jgi:hypothetical protein